MHPQVEVAKNLCILGVLSLQHLAPENAWRGITEVARRNPSSHLHAQPTLAC